jgi:hypothetical protein
MRAADVHENLAHLSRELIELLTEYRGLQQASVRHEAAYRRAFAQAYLEAEGPAEVRKQQAVLATASEYLRAELARVEWDNCRTSLRVLGQRLDAGRTIASTIRAEAISTGVGT